MIRYLNFHTIGNRVIYELCIARSMYRSNNLFSSIIFEIIRE